MPGNVSRGPDCDRVAQGLHFPAGNPYLPPYGDGKMKKLMVLASAAGLAGVAMGVSSGVVGYVNRTLGDGEAIVNVGVTFEPTGEGFTIGEEILGNPAVADDIIYIVNPLALDFDVYMYLGDGTWYGFLATGEEDLLTEIDVGVGDKIAYQPVSGEGGISIAGAVAAFGTQTVEFTVDEVNAFPLVNPFPVETTIGDLNSFCESDDIVYIIDPVAIDFDIYQYLGEGQWFVMYADGTDDIIEDESKVIIAPGDGATIQVMGDRTWTVTRNY